MLTVLFRADASFVLGTGHVMRCLTLAEGLRQRGATAAFVCRELDGHRADLVAERGFRVLRLPAETPGWAEDADGTLAAIGELGVRPDWLVVDLYAADHQWERSLRGSVKRIMVIDDLANRVHDCDLLLDQNLVAGMETRYGGKVPETCGLLLGPDYALLHPAYADLHDRVPPREGRIQRILVFVGGADGDNLTGRIIRAVLRFGRSDLELDVVVAPSGLHVDAVRSLAEDHPNIRVHCGLPTLAPLMARADLAIGAGGATTWERLCLGLPALVVTLADNQRGTIEEMERRGLARWLGDVATVNEDVIEHGLGPLLESGLDPQWSERCGAIVDGRGLGRVCAALTASPDTPLRAREARVADEALLLAWANDPVTRTNAFSTAPIGAASHRSWFRARLRDLENCRLYIVETIDCVPVGQVRFDRKGAAWEIDYAVAPPFRGRGLGRPLLRTAMDRLLQTEPAPLMIGRVKDGNLASRRVFESLQFAAQSDAAERTVVYSSQC